MACHQAVAWSRLAHASLLAGALALTGCAELGRFGHPNADVRWPLPLAASFEDERPSGFDRSHASVTLAPFTLTFWRSMTLARDGEPGSTWGGVELPLWAWSTGTAPADDPDGEVPRFEPAGVPLLFSTLHAEWPGQQRYTDTVTAGSRDPATADMADFRRMASWTPSWAIEDSWQTLWGLGPSYRERVERFAWPDGSVRESTVWEFRPLDLWGLGGLLWTSQEFRAPQVNSSAHGPLGGLLGWFSADTLPERGTGRVNSLVAGVLWFSLRINHSEPTRNEATPSAWWSLNGPLWGMFGWGHSDGEPVIRFLWIPIPLPG